MCDVFLMCSDTFLFITLHKKGNLHSFDSKNWKTFFILAMKLKKKSAPSKLVYYINNEH